MYPSYTPDGYSRIPYQDSHSVDPAGLDWLFTYTTVNKTMNDPEIIVDASILIKQTNSKHKYQ